MTFCSLPHGVHGMAECLETRTSGTPTSTGAFVGVQESPQPAARPESTRLSGRDAGGRVGQQILVIQLCGSAVRPYWTSRSAVRTALVTGPPLPSATCTSPPFHFSEATGVITAAVPQANTSRILPDVAPSRHSSIEIFRSVTV